MRIKALLALLGVILALVLVTGCSNDDNETHFVGQVANFTVNVCDVTNSIPASGATVDLLNSTTGNVVASDTANAEGVATFTNIPICDTVSYQLRATYTTGGVTSIVTSESFVVTSPTPVFPTLFVNSAPGTASFTVAVFDLNDNPVPDANVNLLQNGTPVFETPTVTDANGFAVFTNIPFGEGYSLEVTGTNFPTATKGPCTINELNPAFCTVTVDTTIPQGTVTLSGTISDLPVTESINVALYLNGAIQGSAQTLSVAGSTIDFSFSDLVQRTGSYTIVVTSPTGDFPETTFGPITTGDVNVAGINIPIVTSDAIIGTNGVPGVGSFDTSTIVVFPPATSPSSSVPFTIVDLAGNSVAANGVEYFENVPTTAPVIINGTLDSSTFQLAVNPVPGDFTVIRLADSMVAGTSVATAKKAKK